jgi:hypothetical protein
MVQHQAARKRLKIVATAVAKIIIEKILTPKI